MYLLASHLKARNLHHGGLIDPLRALLFLCSCSFVSKGPKAQCSRVVPTVNNAPDIGESQVFTSYRNSHLYM